MHRHMMYYGNGYGYGDPFFIVFHIIGFILVVLFVVWLLRVVLGGGRHRRWRHMMGDSALELLRERYVKGEIDREEFEQKKRDLTA